MEYLLKCGLTKEDIEAVANNVSDDIYSDLTFLKNMVEKNIEYLKDFGVGNYSQVFVKYPEIFLRDPESFKNVLSKFDKEDLIEKASKNVAVIKKMVDYVDNN